MTGPPLPRSAYSQRAILDALSSGEFVPMRELVRRVYGAATPENETAFRCALARLRERCPGLEIESEAGYRLRRSR